MKKNAIAGRIVPNCLLNRFFWLIRIQASVRCWWCFCATHAMRGRMGPLLLRWHMGKDASPSRDPYKKSWPLGEDGW